MHIIHLFSLALVSTTFIPTSRRFTSYPNANPITFYPLFLRESCLLHWPLKSSDFKIRASCASQSTETRLESVTCSSFRIRSRMRSSENRDSRQYLSALRPRALVEILSSMLLCSHVISNMFSNCSPRELWSKFQEFLRNIQRVRELHSNVKFSRELYSNVNSVVLCSFILSLLIVFVS